MLAYQGFILNLTILCDSSHTWQYRDVQKHMGSDMYPILDLSCPSIIRIFSPQEIAVGIIVNPQEIRPQTKRPFGSNCEGSPTLLVTYEGPKIHSFVPRPRDRCILAYLHVYYTPLSLTFWQINMDVKFNESICSPALATHGN